MPELITNGNVYIGYAPLFEIALGNNKFIYCTTDDEFKKTVAKLKPGYKVSRLKGLGSMTAQGFKETVMNPERRILRQVVIDDLEEAREVLRILQSVNNLTKKDFILTGEFK